MLELLLEVQSKRAFLNKNFPDYLAGMYAATSLAISGKSRFKLSIIFFNPTHVNLSNLSRP